MKTYTVTYKTGNGEDAVASIQFNEMAVDDDGAQFFDEDGDLVAYFAIVVSVIVQS